jgi:hypothetical protein
MQERLVSKVVKGRAAIDGAGVKLVRVFARDEVVDFDPFLMLDAFDSTNSEDYIKGFPWHPHRGIETITYLIKGEIVHEDSLGNSGVIRDGDCQWMTAGSGILHQELPQDSEMMYGLQIWLNLPKKYKMTHPKYNDILSKDVPEVERKGQTIRIIAGSFNGQEGAFNGDFVKPNIYDVSLIKGNVFEVETDSQENTFIYVFKGQGKVSKSEINEKSAIVFTKGDKLIIEALSDDFRFMYFSGLPLRESISWGGPIVMNTKEELDVAFNELKEENIVLNKN